MFNNPFITQHALNRLPRTMLEENRDCSARCAAKIHQFWKGMGKHVEVWLEPIHIGGSPSAHQSRMLYVVKSNLVNGLPR